MNDSTNYVLMNDTRIYYAGTYVRYMLGSITIVYPCISGMYSCPKNSNFKTLPQGSMETFDMESSERPVRRPGLSGMG